MSEKRFWRFTLSAAAGILLSSCASSEIGLTKNPDGPRSSVYSFFENKNETLSRHSLNFLNGHSALEKYQDNPAGLLSELQQEFNEERNPEILEVMTDIALTRARRLSHDPDRAVAYHLSAAKYAYEYIRFILDRSKGDQNILNPGYAAVVGNYNNAVAEIFLYLRKRNLTGKDTYQLKAATGEWIRFKRPVSRLPFPMETFREFQVCANYRPENLNFYSYRFGIGVPLTAVPDLEKIKLKSGKLFPGLALPATVLLNFRKGSDSSDCASLDFYWTDHDDSAKQNRHELPLCHDFSTPLAYQMQQPWIDELASMLRPDSMSRDAGLFLTEPCSPDKIPVVFVHGLMSSAKTWAQLFNTLRNDPEIRKNYQFWFYSYSTGTPVLYSAAEFRKALDHAYRTFTGNSANARKNFDRMVIVGHSMGGLLTKTTVMDSKEDLFHRFFRKSFREVSENLTEKDRNFLKDVFILESKPYVKRVLFLATPHRGSDLASMWFSRLGSKLIHLPGELLDTGRRLFDLVTNRADCRYAGQVKTGIGNLEPDDPVLNALAGIPFKKGIPYHSIIGNIRKSGTPSGSDGIVPYESAHLNGAQSEIVVKSGHSVQKNPLAALEIRRILLLHLKK